MLRVCCLPSRLTLQLTRTCTCTGTRFTGARFAGAGDAEVVLTSLITESIYPGLRLVAELNRAKFVKHLGCASGVEKSNLNHWEYMFERVYAAGDVVNSSFLESLLCMVSGWVAYSGSHAAKCPSFSLSHTHAPCGFLKGFFNRAIIALVQALLCHDIGGLADGELSSDDDECESDDGSRPSQVDALGNEVHDGDVAASPTGSDRGVGHPMSRVTTTLTYQHHHHQCLCC